MQAQSTADAKQALLLLQRHLSPAELELLTRLAEQMSPETGLSAAAAQSLLFPEVGNEETQAKKLSELVKRHNAAAESAGSATRLKISGSKKSGQHGRFLTFFGPTVLTSSAEMPDLASIADKRLLPQRGQPTNPLVLVTVNQHEHDAVLDVFLGDLKHNQTIQGGLVYDRLGVHGGFDIWHTTTQMGTAGPGATLSRVTEIIGELRPVAVIAVGVAFGVDPASQPIGQVLVSEKLFTYEPERVGVKKRNPRGDRVTPSTLWLQRARAANGKWRRNKFAAWPPVQFGTLLSGEKLIDDLKLRNRLIQLSGGEAIGGEMEGAGLYAATHSRKVDWLVIKSVCDYADGNKSENKQERQKLAARCAAQVARAVIDIDWDPTSKPLPPLACNAMGIIDLSGIIHVVPSRAKPVSLRKATTPGNSSDSTTGDAAGVDVQEYLLNWVRQVGGAPLFALLGEYGMGKTIACQQLVKTVDELRRRDVTLPRPLYFDLRKLTGLRERVPTLDDILGECIDRGWDRSTSLLPKVPQIHSLVREGALVVFDGLDEALVHLRESDGQVFTQELLRILPQKSVSGPSRSRVLISCRTHYFRSLRDQNNHFTGQERGQIKERDFDALILLPFIEEQIEQYLSAVLPHRDIEEVMAVIGSVHNLTDMSQRPYTLRLISELLPEIETLRADGKRVYGVTLYREMVKRWLERDAGKHHIRPEHKQRLAAYLAAELWRRRTRLITSAELESWFQLWLKGQADIAARYSNLHPDWLEEDLRTATFIVREDDGPTADGGFRYAHSSLQEYFLAEYLYKALRDDDKSAWAMPAPSQESLRFLGELMAEHDNSADTARLEAWSRNYLAGVNELLLRYTNLARSEKPALPIPNLMGIDLSGAQLQDLELGSEDLDIQIWDIGSAKFCGADLSRSKFFRVNLDGSNLAYAKLEHLEWLGGSAKFTTFSDAKLCGARLRGVDLSGAIWSEADAYHAEFLLCTSAPTHLAHVKVAPDPDRRRSSTDLLLDTAHHAAANCCAWSPDGKRIVSSASSSLYIFDAQSGAPMIALVGHEHQVSDCSWSPDGRCLLSASWDKTLRVWDTHRGSTLFVLSGHPTLVTACAWSPDGSHLASASHGIVTIWSARNGTEIRLLRGHQGWISICAWSPDGRRLASVSDDGTLRIWDIDTGTELVTISEHKTISGCSWSPDGLRLLSISKESSSIFIFDSSTGAVTHTAEDRSEGPIACVWLTAGPRVLAVSSHRRLTVWNPEMGNHFLPLRTSSSDALAAAAWSPDGTNIAAACWDGRLLFLNTVTGVTFVEIPGRRVSVAACAWSPDNQLFFTSDKDILVTLDASTGAIVNFLSGKSDSGESYAFSTDCKSVLSASYDGSLLLRNVETGSTLRTLGRHTSGIAACSFSPDDQRLASASWDKTLKLWSATTGAELLTLTGHDDWVTSCNWSPDSKKIASTSDDNTLRIWDSGTGDCLLALKEDEEAFSGCSWSPDGSLLAATGWSGLFIWDTRTGERVQLIEEHEEVAGAVCEWAPNGQTLVCSFFDDTLRIFDVESGNQQACLRGHDGKILDCCWSPSGQFIVSISSDCTLRIWRAKDGIELYRIRDSFEGLALVRDNEVLATRGDAWRELNWQVPNGNGGFEMVPVETFGEMMSWTTAGQQELELTSRTFDLLHLP